MRLKILQGKNSNSISYITRRSIFGFVPDNLQYHQLFVFVCFKMGFELMFWYRTLTRERHLVAISLKPKFRSDISRLGTDLGTFSKVSFRHSNDFSTIRFWNSSIIFWWSRSRYQQPFYRAKTMVAWQKHSDGDDHRKVFHNSRPQMSSTLSWICIFNSPGMRIIQKSDFFWETINICSNWFIKIFSLNRSSLVYNCIPVTIFSEW